GEAAPAGDRLQLRRLQRLATLHLVDNPVARGVAVVDAVAAAPEEARARDDRRKMVSVVPLVELVLDGRIDVDSRREVQPSSLAHPCLLVRSSNPELSSI